MANTHSLGFGVCAKGLGRGKLQQSIQLRAAQPFEIDFNVDYHSVV